MTYLVMGYTTGQVPADPNHFLLHSDTTDGSTTFVDSSPNNITITPTNANVYHSTTQAKFGGSSIFFAGGALLMNDPLFQAGTGEYTIDFWIYRTANFITTGLYAGGVIADQTGAQCYTNNGTDEAVFDEGNNSLPTPNIPVNVPLNTWTHYAWVRDTSENRVYENGILKGTLNLEGYVSNGPLFAIGARYALGNHPLTNAYIDEFRYTRTVEFTSNFTPPTEPY